MELLLRRSFTITDKLVRMFARIVGDNNPVHIDEDAASQTRFKKRIAHGMVSVSYLHSMLPPNCYLQNMNVKFLKPVYIGETITITFYLREQERTFKAIIEKEEQGSLEKKISVVTTVSAQWEHIQWYFVWFYLDYYLDQANQKIHLLSSLFVFLQEWGLNISNLGCKKAELLL